ncbi:MAG: dihydroorotate dehydrogenase [Patescibacteria group bacterium]
MDLSVKFCGVKFKNPLVLASGILGITAASWRNVVANGAGGITTKSLWLNEHKGHKNPVMIGFDTYMLNAVGVPDAGIEKSREEIPEYLKKKPAPLIASITAGTISDFGKVAEAIARLKPDILEINISCPNVQHELGKPFACVPHDAAGVTTEVKKCLHAAKIKIPITVKLSPNVENIVSIAKAVVDAGADGLTMINTAGPGMAINIETRKPILTNKVGGISGPFLKPLAVKMIFDVRKALPSTPVIGVGGILTGADAIEMMMAGATLVGIGTGVYFRGVEVFKKCTDEMAKWCAANGVKKISDIINAAHV